ncbi:condensation domain-containing protein [Streptosporangium canum]|uniref:condensation domain-containing protein n=1 Tax=Streptosporangium canum TaxID=324952 RepID=UPI0033ACEDAD
MDNVEDIYELSPLQQGMLLHSTHDGAADMYLSQHMYEVEGPLDDQALEETWHAVLEAHPSLRTSFHWEGLDKPLQVVHRDVKLPVHRHDWRGLDAAQQRDRLERLHVEDRAAGFDLTAAPLQRLHLVRLADDRHNLTWTYHHLLLDGWSVAVVMTEVMARFAGGASPSDPPPYRDYIAWLQQRDPEAAKDFWTRTLAGVEPSRLVPLRSWDPLRGTGEVTRQTVDLPERLGQRLREAAARHRVTFGTMVQGAWAAVLRRYSGRSDVVFGSTSSGRPAELPQVERMVGLFANTLPVRVSVPDDGDVGAWLRDIQERYAQTRRYEYTPLADIKTWAGTSGRSLFESLVVLENAALAVNSAGSGQPGQPTFHRDALYDKISFPLTLTVAPQPVSELQVLIHRERFDEGFIDDVLARLHAVFESLASADHLAAVISAAGPDSVAQAAPAAFVTAAEPLSAEAALLEEKISEVFREILALPELDPTASFFDLGGDSFAAVRVVSRIDGASVGLLASHPSVRRMAQALLDAGRGSPAPDTTPEADAEQGVGLDDELDQEIAELQRRLAGKLAERSALNAGPVPVARDGSLACTFQQEAVWFMNQYDPASTVYHIPFPLRIRGRLNVEVLERALHGLVTRHEALRTRFVNEGGLPIQVIDPPAAVRLEPIDLPADQVESWAAEECTRPFDLARGPVFRYALARLAPDDHALVLVFHHIVADGWSAAVLGGELSALYAAGGEAGLEPLTVQPADYAAWQRRRLRGAELERRLGYWRENLAGLPTVHFPADRRRPERPTGLGDTLDQQLPAELSQAVRACAREHQVSLLAVLQAALLVVLHRYTGQRDLPIGSIFSGRTRPDIESLVGFFGNTVVLRTSLDGEPSFGELARRCHETILNATAHQDVPFSLVVDALRPERAAGRNPLFQVGLTLLPRAIGATDLSLGEVSIEPIVVPERYALYDISVDVADVPDGSLPVAVEYATDLFDADRIDRFIDHYLTALAEGVAAPERRAADLEILTAAERERALRDTELLARHPGDGEAALVDGDGTRWTHRQLDAAAGRIANRLRRADVAAGDTVGLCLPPGADLITALLAVWKVGGQAVQVTAEEQPASGEATGSGQVTAPGQAAAPTLVLTHAEHAGGFTTALALDAERGSLAAEPAGPPVQAAEPYLPPATETERWLVATVAELLEAEQVGVGDDLFGLGGSSLHATQLVARLRVAFGVEVPVRDLFANPSLRQLAARLEEDVHGAPH